MNENPEPLSERERQIVRLGAGGMTDKEIADRLAVSITTVRTYWVRLRKKLNATNRAQAIANAVRNVERAHLRDALARLVRQAWFGLGVLDKRNKILESNSLFLELTGGDPERITKRMDADGRLHELCLPTLSGGKRLVFCALVPMAGDSGLKAAYIIAPPSGP